MEKRKKQTITQSEQFQNKT